MDKIDETKVCRKLTNPDYVTQETVDNVNWFLQEARRIENEMSKNKTKKSICSDERE